MIQDNDMMYDKVRGRYILTKDYVQNELGLDLQVVAIDDFDSNPTTLPDRLLKRTSNMVYEYMKRECADFKYACELIETRPDLNADFKDVLYYELESFINFGDRSLNEDEDSTVKISKRGLEILKGNRLLTIQKKKELNFLDYMFDNFGSGGVY